MTSWIIGGELELAHKYESGRSCISAGHRYFTAAEWSFVSPEAADHD
jgi:hypothetical protein